MIEYKVQISHDFKYWKMCQRFWFTTLNSSPQVGYVVLGMRQLREQKKMTVYLCRAPDKRKEVEMVQFRSKSVHS